MESDVLDGPVDVTTQQFVMKFSTRDTIFAKDLARLLIELSEIYLILEETNANINPDATALPLDRIINDFKLNKFVEMFIISLRKGFIEHILENRIHLDENSAHAMVRDYIRKSSGQITGYPFLEIGSISFNSPLTISFRGTILTLVVLSFITGGKFSATKEGIHVEMPGIGNTIKTVYETIAPARNKEFREDLKSALETQASEQAEDLLFEIEMSNNMIQIHEDEGSSL